DRNGTEAVTRPAHVDRATVARRAARLRAVGAAKALAFRQALIGCTDDVLVLETRDRATGGLVGLTGNYVEVVFEGPDALMRRTARVRLVAAGAGGRGELAGSGGRVAAWTEASASWGAADSMSWRACPPFAGAASARRSAIPRTSSAPATSRGDGSSSCHGTAAGTTSPRRS